MPKRQPARVDLLQGTLDLLILRTLQFGPAHGHALAKRIKQTSEDVLQIETGSLYPALHRLEARGWLASSWKLSELGKRAKYYSLTPLGRKELAAGRTNWEKFSRAIGLVLNPPDPELS
jgi:transcriptional regulator